MVCFSSKHRISHFLITWIESKQNYELFESGESFCYHNIAVNGGNHHYLRITSHVNKDTAGTEEVIGKKKEKSRYIGTQTQFYVMVLWGRYGWISE